VLSLFSSGREEDRMVGYLSFLKVGPKLLQFVPGNKVWPRLSPLAGEGRAGGRTPAQPSRRIPDAA
jgi:hypothetical protein